MYSYTCSYTWVSVFAFVCCALHMYVGVRCYANGCVQGLNVFEYFIKINLPSGRRDDTVGLTEREDRYPVTNGSDGKGEFWLYTYSYMWVLYVLSTYTSVYRGRLRS